MSLSCTGAWNEIYFQSFWISQEWHILPPNTKRMLLPLQVTSHGLQMAHLIKAFITLGTFRPLWNTNMSPFLETTLNPGHKTKVSDTSWQARERPLLQLKGQQTRPCRATYRQSCKEIKNVFLSQSWKLHGGTGGAVLKWTSCWYLSWLLWNNSLLVLSLESWDIR